MKLSRIWPWVLFMAVVAGTAWLWHGGPGGGIRSTLDKPAPAVAEGAPADAQQLAQQLDGAVVSATTLIVDYRDDVSDADLAATPEVEQPISRWSAVDRLYRVDFASPDAAAAAAARLRADPKVESVDWDTQVSLPPDELRGELTAAGDPSMQEECGQTGGGGAEPAFPSDPCYRYQWHLRQIGLPDAWKLGRGKGVVVAVIDTGVSKVPDLAGTKLVPGYNFVTDTNDASDDHGHGTHVAGTIAQTTHNRLGVGGVAFEASIMPLKVLSARGSGSIAAISQSIRYAADHGAQVINMSLGGPMPVGSLATAVKYAREKGVTVVAAAGNDGRGRVSYPARYPGVVAVAATQFDERTTFYSNWGNQIDIAAPGGNTRVDQNGDGKPDGVLQNTIVPTNTSTTDYLWFMGTSMASPHVAGVAALVIGAGVTKPDAVEEILLGTARAPKPGDGDGGGDRGAARRIDDHYGAGIVDANAALQKIRKGRGAGELGVAGAFALLGLSFLSRRGRGARQPLGLGFVAALVLGSSGLFLLPSWLPSLADGAGGLLTTGVLGGVDGLRDAAARGNPLLWSAILPVALTVVLYGFRRLRPALAGLGFGVAGALLGAAIFAAFDIRYVPDLLDRAWLVANAAVAAVVATVALRR